MPYYVDKATRHPSIAYYNSPTSKLLPPISHFTETVQKCKAAPCASPLSFRASDRITGAGIRAPPRKAQAVCGAAHARRRLISRNTVDTSRMPTASEPAMPTVSSPLPTAVIISPSSPRLMV